MERTRLGGARWFRPARWWRPSCWLRGRGTCLAVSCSWCCVACSRLIADLMLAGRSPGSLGRGKPATPRVPADRRRRLRPRRNTNPASSNSTRRCPVRARPWRRPRARSTCRSSPTRRPTGRRQRWKRQCPCSGSPFRCPPGAGPGTRLPGRRPAPHRRRGPSPFPLSSHATDLVIALDGPQRHRPRSPRTALRPRLRRGPPERGPRRSTRSSTRQTGRRRESSPTTLWLVFAAAMFPAVAVATGQ